MKLIEGHDTVESGSFLGNALLILCIMVYTKLSLRPHIPQFHWQIMMYEGYLNKISWAMAHIVIHVQLTYILFNKVLPENDLDKA